MESNVEKLRAEITQLRLYEQKNATSCNTEDRFLTIPKTHRKICKEDLYNENTISIAFGKEARKELFYLSDEYVFKYITLLFIYYI